MSQYLINSFSVSSTGSGFDLDELVAYYTWNEGSGAIVNQAGTVGSTDSLGTAANIAITGATYSQTGIIDEALSFDGTNDYGEMGTSLSQWNFFHAVDQDWSINLWLNLPQVNAAALVFSNLDSTETRGINIEATRSSTATAISIKSDNGFMANAEKAVGTIPIGSWFMLSITCDYSASEYRWYLNGVDKGTTSRSANGSTGDAEYSLKTMCRGNTADLFVDGKQDETSIWKRCLTAAEITSLYNSGNGLSL